MKPIFKLSLLVLSLSFGINSVYAGNNPHCEAKRQSIERQLAYAKSAGNKYRVAGLEKALDNVNTYCTDEGLQSKTQDDINDLQKELREEQSELAKIQRRIERAEASGDKEKVAKYEEKLADQQDDIKELETEIKEATDYLKTLQK